MLECPCNLDLKIMSNKTSFTIELTEAELDIFRDMWNCLEVQIYLRKFKLPEFDSAVDKITDALRPPEPPKAASLDDYFQF